jgi:hypothetical protein
MGNLFGKQKDCKDGKATPEKPPKTSKNDPKPKETKTKPSDKKI